MTRERGGPSPARACRAAPAPPAPRTASPATRLCCQSERGGASAGRRARHFSLLEDRVAQLVAASVWLLGAEESARGGGRGGGGGGRGPPREAAGGRLPAARGMREAGGRARGRRGHRAHSTNTYHEKNAVYYLKQSPEQSQTSNGAARGDAERRDPSRVHVKPKGDPCADDRAPPGWYAAPSRRQSHPQPPKFRDAVRAHEAALAVASRTPHCTRGAPWPINDAQALVARPTPRHGAHTRRHVTRRHSLLSLTHICARTLRVLRRRRPMLRRARAPCQGRGFVDVPGRCPVFARETVCNLPSPKYRFCATQLAKLEAALGRPLVRLQSNESARPPHPKVRRSMGVMQGRAQGDFRGRQSVRRASKAPTQHWLCRSLTKADPLDPDRCRRRGCRGRRQPLPVRGFQRSARCAGGAAGRGAGAAAGDVRQRAGHPIDRCGLLACRLARLRPLGAGGDSTRLTSFRKRELPTHPAHSLTDTLLDPRRTHAKVRASLTT